MDIKKQYFCLLVDVCVPTYIGGHRDHDRMVVGFTKKKR